MTRQCSAAVADVKKYMTQLKRKKLVMYPFAHLSSNLSGPKEAMELIAYMSESAAKELEVRKAPFGWNKKFTIAVKGHPMAEQSRSYGNVKEAGKVEKHVSAKRGSQYIDSEEERLVRIARRGS